METFQRRIEHLELFDLWKQIFTTEDPDPEIFEDPGMTDDGKSFVISSTFDYDLTDCDNLLFFYDITIRLPRVAIQSVRCSFKVNTNPFQDMFTEENLRYPVSTTIFYAFDLLKDLCTDNELPFPEGLDPDYPNVDDEMLVQMCTEITDLFYHNRIPYDIEHDDLMNEYGLAFTPGWEMKNMLFLTFFVLDELVYLNLNFNRYHNRKEFFAQVPEMKYTSLKLKCRRIEKQDLELTDLESVFLLRCIECVVHILLSTKGDRLQSMLKKWGAGEEVMKYFYKTTTMIFQVYHKPKVEEILHASKQDWEKLIR